LETKEIEVIEKIGNSNLNIAKTIRKARRDREISQKALAKKLSIHPMSIYQYERGQVPSGKTLLSIMRELNLTINDFERKETDEKDRISSNRKD